MATASTGTTRSWGETLDDFRALRGAPRELWIVFAVKFLESLAYFAIYNLIAVYLSADLGYSDVEAGTVAGVWLTVISVMTFFSGFVADALSIRRALLVSVISCTVGRILLSVSTARPIALLAFGVMSWGVASMMPTMTAAVRRYTSRRTVSFGFSLFYVTMNVGALVAPLTIGWFRRHLAHGATLSLPLLGPTAFSSSRLVFAVGVVATVVALGLVATMRPDHLVPAAEGADEPAPEPSGRTTPWSALKEVVAESTFWRFMLFVSLLVLVKLIFQHAHLTWPKYTLRVFGESFPFADYWAINPAMIIVLTPLVTALTRNRSAFQCIVWGSLLSAGSVFFMAASTTPAASVAFIVTLSLSEALWSPRLYEYTATIAPRGREASYMGLSQLPMFLAKPVVGTLSGAMLAAWCPAVGPRHPQTLWAVIGLSTLVGPILIVLLRRVIQPGSPLPAAAPSAA